MECSLLYRSTNSSVASSTSPVLAGRVGLHGAGRSDCCFVLAESESGSNVTRRASATQRKRSTIAWPEGLGARLRLAARRRGVVLGREAVAQPLGLRPVAVTGVIALTVSVVVRARSRPMASRWERHSLVRLWVAILAWFVLDAVAGMDSSNLSNRRSCCWARGGCIRARRRGIRRIIGGWLRRSSSLRRPSWRSWICSPRSTGCSGAVRR